MSLVAGSLIDTLFGPMPVDRLGPGDPVLVDEGRPRPLLAVCREMVTPERAQDDPRQRPILIRRNALGRGCPSRDILVSSGQIVRLPDGRGRSARGLVDGRRVQIVHPRRSLTMVFPVLDAPYGLRANGLTIITPRLSTRATALLAPPQHQTLLDPARSLPLI